MYDEMRPDCLFCLGCGHEWLGPLSQPCPECGGLAERECVGEHDQCATDPDEESR